MLTAKKLGQDRTTNKTMDRLFGSRAREKILAEKFGPEEFRQPGVRDGWRTRPRRRGSERINRSHILYRQWVKSQSHGETSTTPPG
jgi:hypothetical protein